MSEQARFRIDVDLHAIAQNVLDDAGFTTETLVDDGGCLLAENEYSILGVVAVPTLVDLLNAEPVIGGLLQGRIDISDVGPKLWDAYVVLLTQERLADEGEGMLPLFGINYDTRGFRRIARTGVQPTIRAVRSALSPFVEPVRLREAGLAVDPLASLSEALVNNGVLGDLATRAVQVYREGGRLDDVL